MLIPILFLLDPRLLGQILLAKDVNWIRRQEREIDRPTSNSWFPVLRFPRSKLIHGPCGLTCLSGERWSMCRCAGEKCGTSPAGKKTSKAKLQPWHDQMVSSLMVGDPPGLLAQYRAGEA